MASRSEAVAVRGQAVKSARSFVLIQLIQLIHGSRSGLTRKTSVAI